ncbi:bifunctional 4-hydroxy-2-oxoglutarate aldolase/2-dehydro-3-deoxy-phosphogluconate aldolase [Agromyces binzhouensis]|uniref:bifunctional 4-hydroxy-2-oxoglutarate aldolase/2-dehydro-3-deoxy-phosphogluconate aldolase n=1 Tax=Agromyces binzhouensis TaxID=1817495 RepID=UPI00362C6628
MRVTEALRALPLIAVIRADRAAEYQRIVPALIAGGVRTIELTMTTPGTLDMMPELQDELPDDAKLGVGTVRSVDQALSAIERGADFIVSPHIDRAIVAAARTRKIPVYPGALTPTEINLALTAGATAVKLFPAGATSPALAKQLLGPFPELEFMPSGGIGLEDVSPWLAAGAAAVCVGGPLVGGSDSSTADIIDRARRYVDVATEARQAD